MTNERQNEKTNGKSYGESGSGGMQGRRPGGTSAGHISAARISTIAVAIVINYIGGQLALLLHLPIYLDSIGTILAACLYGPAWGVLPPLLSGLVMAFTGDIYSLYFAPVGMILGAMTGLVARRSRAGLSGAGQNRSTFRGFSSHSRTRLLLDALLITLPGTIVSSIINAYVFGGVTSSGSSLLVQLLAHTPLGLTGSIFAVQILTDYLDRLVSLLLVRAVLNVPAVKRMAAG